MTRIEVNLQTGEVKIIPLTQLEIDDALARQALEAAQPVVKSPLQRLEDRVAVLEARTR